MITKMINRHNTQGQAQLREIILACFDALDTYGKKPEQLANAAKMFQLIDIAASEASTTNREVLAPKGI